MNEPKPFHPQNPRPRLPFVRAGLVAVALLSAVLSAEVPASAEPWLQSDHDNYFPGEEIRIAFRDGPGNPRDWIGVYPLDAEPGPVAATIWRYVDGTGTGATGLKEGTIVFPTGLALGGDWTAFFLLNDGYTKLATNHFRVIDPGSTALRLDKRQYTVGESISVTFTNGYAEARDWVGLYRVGQTPGSTTPSTRWAYVDGTQTGTTGIANGTLVFPTGIPTAGDWVAHFLYNDTYDIIASETFTVVAETSVLPRVVSLSPSTGSSNLSPVLEFSASLVNGTSKVVPSTVQLLLDGASVVPTVTTVDDRVTVSYTGTALAPAGSEHVWMLTLQDDATPPNTLVEETRGVVRHYRNIVLADPIVFENFDAVPEGSLPPGWTETGYSTPINEGIDFGDLGSAAYRTWTTVEANRFTGSFVTYGNPENPPDWGTDYQRVLTPNADNVVNGQVFSGPFAKGRFLFGNSGYQNGSASQVMFLFTPDFNLAGKTNVHLGFNSLWEQNQDSIATLEYSINRGQTWLPIAYFINAGDLIRVTNEISGEVTLDAEATLNTEYGDVARYTDDQGNEFGGTYGAFVAAPISPALAPYIQGRIDDNPSESKRVEWFRLPEADNQTSVRFRFGHAGTDSWYFGIDDFGLYAPSANAGPPPNLTVTPGTGNLTLSWPADVVGYVLESKPSLTGGTWEPVPGVTGNTHTVSTGGAGAFYRLRR